MGYVMKKASFIVLSIALVFLLALCTFAEEEPLPGKDITESVSLNFTVGNGRSARLLDRNVESACSADDLFVGKRLMDTLGYEDHTADDRNIAACHNNKDR